MNPDGSQMVVGPQVQRSPATAPTANTQNLSALARPTALAPQQSPLRAVPFASGNANTQPPRRSERRRAVIIFGIALTSLALLGLVIWLLGTLVSNSQQSSLTPEQKISNFTPTTIPLDELSTALTQAGKAQQLLINGQVQIADSLVLTPSNAIPTAPKIGQLYYDQATNQPYYYNGSGFVSVSGQSITNNITNVTNNTTSSTTTNIISPATVDLQNNVTGTLQTANGGTGAGSFTTNGILYGNGANTIQVTNAAANSVLVTNGANTPSLSQTLPSAVQNNITGTGTLTSGSITTGFGAINTTNNIATTATVQGGSMIVGIDGGIPPDAVLRAGAASGNNVVGSTFFIDASNGTGAGGSGDIVLRTAPVATTAISFDAASHANAVGTSLTWTHATGVHNNMALIVGVTLHNAARSVSSVVYTYNGGANQQSLTKVDAATVNGVFSGEDVEMWYLPSPTLGSSPGTNTITVSVTGAAVFITAGASSYYNVDPGTPLDLANRAKTSGTAPGGANTATATVLNTTTGQVVTDVFGNNNAGVVPTVGAGQTQRYTENNNVWGSDKGVVSSSTAMSWDNLNTTDYVLIAVAMNPAPNSTPDTQTERLRVTAEGNVGINDGTPDNTLKVVGSLCVSDTPGACAGNTAGTIYATDTTVQSADLAENYISAAALEPGDLVMIAGDGNNQAVKKTSGGTSRALGVISTKPGVTLNSDAQTDAAHPYKYPLALSGRVPVKVSTENGPINPGDYLAPSSQPGVATKLVGPGQSIGQALESFSGDNIGTVTTFLDLSWTNADLNGNNFNVQNADGTTLLNADPTTMTVTVSALKVVGEVTIGGHIITTGQTPTINANTTLCSNEPVEASITGNDTSGTITITLGSDCSDGPADLATIHFAKPFGAAPKVLISPNNQISATLLGFADDQTAASFTLNAAGPAGDHKTYSWNYFVTQ